MAVVMVVMVESLIKLSKNWNLKRRIFNQKITQARERAEDFSKYFIIHFIENICLINFIKLILPAATPSFTTTRIAYSMETTSIHIKNINFAQI